MSTIFVKNMVCNRCILAVEQELKKLKIDAEMVKLGEIKLKKAPSEREREELAASLEALGFEIIGDKNGQVIEKIKTLIIDLIYQQDNAIQQNLSTLLSEELHQDYQHLSSIFSNVEGVTIEKYYIAQKIERVKELLVYDELTLSEIAFQLNYSSVAYLSNQFKKITGLTPSHFKSIGKDRRKPLDEV